MICHPVFLPGDELEHACDQLHDAERRKAECAARESSPTDSTDGVAAIGGIGIEPQEKMGRFETQTETAEPLFALTYSDKYKYGKKVWPKGKVIKVYFIDSHPHQNEVLHFAAEWSRHCSIGFAEVNDRRESEVRISFDETLSSYSMVGTDALRVSKGERTMNLAVMDKGTILHEFGHVLGLLHEHQSPIKGIIQWNVRKVLETFQGPPNYWKPAQIKSQILDRHERESVMGSTYDMRSIMHYSFAKELILTIDGRPPLTSDIPFIEQLSPTDKLVVEKLYGPSGTKPPPSREDIGGEQHYDITAGEEMKFTFKSDPRHRRQYTIQTVGKEADLSLSLYGPYSEDQFIAAATDGGENGNPRIMQDVLPGRTYHILIRAFAKGGAFSLRISTVIRRFATAMPV